MLRGMGERFSDLTARYRSSPETMRRELADPVLVWEAAPPEEQKMEGDLIWKTAPGHKRKTGGKDPLVFQLKKGLLKKNAFGIGVTLGRTNNNDLVIDDASVSRFHCWFQIDPASGIWHVADAESSNGTWLGDERLSPDRPAPVNDGTLLGVGDVVLAFLAPASFHAWILKTMLGA